MELPDLEILINSPLKHMEDFKAMLIDLQSQCPECWINEVVSSKELITHIFDGVESENILELDIEKLKPSIENIEYAKRIANDLTYFLDGNHKFHTILEGQVKLKY